MATIQDELERIENVSKWYVGLCAGLLAAIGTILTVLKPLKAYEHVSHPNVLLVALTALILLYVLSLIIFALCVVSIPKPTRARRLYRIGITLFILGSAGLASMSLLLVLLPSPPALDVSIPSLSVFPQEEFHFPVTVNSSRPGTYIAKMNVLDPTVDVTLTFPSEDRRSQQSEFLFSVMPPNATTLVARGVLLASEPPPKVLARIELSSSGRSPSLFWKTFEISVVPMVKLHVHDLRVSRRRSSAFTFFVIANFSGPAVAELHGAAGLDFSFHQAMPSTANRTNLSLKKNAAVPIASFVSAKNAPRDAKAILLLSNSRGLLASAEFRVLDP